MSRVHRVDNVGMHIVSSSSRPYGKCPRCKEVKPIHWVSKTRALCYACLKKTGKKRYIPKLAKECSTLPPTRPKRKNRRLY